MKEASRILAFVLTLLAGGCADATAPEPVGPETVEVELTRRPVGDSVLVQVRFVPVAGSDFERLFSAAQVAEYFRAASDYDPPYIEVLVAGRRLDPRASGEFRLAHGGMVATADADAVAVHFRAHGDRRHNAFRAPGDCPNDAPVAVVADTAFVAPAGCVR